MFILSRFTISVRLELHWTDRLLVYVNTCTTDKTQNMTMTSFRINLCVLIQPAAATYEGSCRSHKAEATVGH
jgi:hypothetical protein